MTMFTLPWNGALLPRASGPRASGQLHLSAGRTRHALLACACQLHLRPKWGSAPEASYKRPPYADGIPRLLPPATRTSPLHLLSLLSCITAVARFLQLTAYRQMHLLFPLPQALGDFVIQAGCCLGLHVLVQTLLWATVRWPIHMPAGAFLGSAWSPRPW